MDQGHSLLVHACGVNIQPQRCSRPPAVLRPSATDLPEEVIEQIRGILHPVNNIADPYRALKIRLLNLFTPKPLDLCQKIIHSSELCDRRPSQLMESMLALLPPGEPDGMLFKTHFINRLPLDIRYHMVAGGFTSAPGRWRQWQTTSGLPETAGRAATDTTRWRQRSWRMWRSMRRRWPLSTCSPSTPAQEEGRQGRQGQGHCCYVHKKYGANSWKCADPTTCKWTEN